MSATTRNQVFSAVHTVGGLLPADMLLRIADGKDVKGSTPPTTRSSAPVPYATRPNATGTT